MAAEERNRLALGANPKEQDKSLVALKQEPQISATQSHVTWSQHMCLLDAEAGEHFRIPFC